MNGKLHVDTAVITSAARGTFSIKSRLESAAADAAELEGMIPVSDLRRTSVAFASEWEIGRKKMIEEIVQLSEQLDSTAEAFDNADAELAKRLSENLGK